MLTNHQKDFIKIFDSFDYKFSRWELFQDFCGIAAWNLRKPLYPALKDDIEARFKRYDSKYDQCHIDKMAEAFGLIVMDLEVCYHDFLGEVYMDMGLGKNQMGQFFTPSHLCNAMARIALGNIQSEVEEKGYVTVSDPACGAGATLIAVVNAVIEAKLNPSTDIYIEAQDIDELATQMCYIQLSLCGVAAKIIHGNTLSMEIWTEYATPVYLFNGWYQKLAMRKLVDSVASNTKEYEIKVEQEPTPVMATVGDKAFKKTDKGQYLLFA